MCTASQLGIHRQRGAPSLLDALLPSTYSSSTTTGTTSRSVPLASRRWLERLLLLPPPPPVAGEIRRALEVLGSPTLGAVPRWFSLPAPHIVLKLRSGEASAGFFRDLVAMLDGVVSVARSSRSSSSSSFLTSSSTTTTTAKATQAPQTKRGEEPKHELHSLAQALLSPTAEETGTRLSLQELAEACQRAVALVEATVADVRGGSFVDDDDDELFDFGKLESVTSSSPPPSRALKAALLDLFDANEGAYSGQVHASLLAEELAAVKAARERVARAAAELVSKISKEKKSKAAASRASSSAAAKEPEVVFDAVNNAVWVRMPRGGSSSISTSSNAAEGGEKEENEEEASRKRIVHPLDRYGRRVADRWSSAELEGALDAYRRRCVAARAAVRGALRALARELADGSGGGGSESEVEATSSSSSSSSVSTMAGLVSAATFSTIGAALDAHAREAAAKGWGLPRLVVEEEEEEDEDELSSSSTISISSFWPFWLQKQESQPNSIDLRSMALLTGPNMAGKSTVLRSVAACSLLASCGLHAPAEAASVPALDAIVLRAFAADAPSSGRSSFAVEMDETRHVLAAAKGSSRSLILVDELGKGEPRNVLMLLLLFPFSRRRCRSGPPVEVEREERERKKERKKERTHSKNLSTS